MVATLIDTWGLPEEADCRPKSSRRTHKGGQLQERESKGLKHRERELSLDVSNSEEKGEAELDRR